MTVPAALRRLLEAPGVVLAAGAPDALMARFVEQAGFPLCLIGGAALSMSRGYPDVGLLTLPELAEATRSIAEAVEIPVLVDADTGFGSAINVWRTVRTLERAGAAGLHIEDQAWPKRAGHMVGKQVVPVEEMIGKLKVAKTARRNHDFVIVARCDALAVNGLVDALDRGEAYLSAGADMLFFETEDRVEDVEAIGERFGGRVPLLYNHSESGRVPRISAEYLGALGFKVVAFYGHAHLAACRAAQEVLAEIKRTENSLTTWNRMLPLDEFWEVCRLSELLAIQHARLEPPSD